ncbi:MAG: aminopeptidase [Gammaproteobacteria bacterium]
MTNKPAGHLPRFLLLLCCLSQGACSTLGYYGHAVTGHLDVLRSRQPIQAILENDRADPNLRDKLIHVRELLDFAHDELALPDNGSYRHYADLNRPFVAWNIFAAPELSLQPRSWCYPLAGCFDYRGYFNRDSAMKHAMQLQEQNWDVYVGGVRAYSTLGWFRDPVLNTMLDQDDWKIARLIFHELAHQKLYIKNRIDINEAFAESVARIGLERWLEARGEDAIPIRHALVYEDAFMSLVLDYKERLGALYESDQPRTDKVRRKDQILAELRRDYHQLKQRHDGSDRYDRWISIDLNNAKLAAIATYRQWMPEFMALYTATGNDLASFYSYMESIRHCPDHLLQHRIRQYNPGKSC